jgi:hypothetical protein
MKVKIPAGFVENILFKKSIGILFLIVHCEL